MKKEILKVLKTYESKGNRVIASAWTEITDEFEYDEIDKYKLTSFESKMNFNGLAIFKSSLKPNARDIIVEIIQSGASFKMITGDALNTSQFI